MSTSAPRSWADLAGLRVGLWGLGIEGVAAAARLRRLGTAPSVVADDDPRGREVDGVPVVATADALADLSGCDVVVKTPGISRYRPEVAALTAEGVTVTTGVALWLNGADLARVACITGSKGKSTTTSIAGHLARGLGARPFVGGNLGLPPFDPGAPSDVDFWLVEISSYQAADLDVSPAVTAVTSLSPDHLPWHQGSVERYYADKLSLCRRPGARVTVAAGDDPELAARAGGLAPDVRWVDPVPVGGWADLLHLPGRHNRSNAAIAAAVLDELGVDGADDPDRLAGAASVTFEALPSRLRTIGRLDGVDFVDDSLSTNVLPTVVAVDAFPDRRVALLLGGQTRSIDYGPLAERLQLVAGHQAILAVIMTDTETAVDMATAFRRRAGDVELVESEGLVAAVALAYRWARPGGVVLLSPAAPSFGMYENYEARSRAFIAAVGALGAVPADRDG